MSRIRWYNNILHCIQARALATYALKVYRRIDKLRSSGSYDTSVRRIDKLRSSGSYDTSVRRINKLRSSGSY
jgi:hypothetical protein